jgi:YHS domain-containing protein
MITKRTFLLGLVTAAAAAPVATPALAAEPQVYAESGIALGGTDPVAYFTDGLPTQGTAAHSHDWNGAEWRFASEANRAAFAADPARYAPQYGGYCAWAVAEGYTAPTDPDAWKIVEDKLYLNFSRGVQRRWQRDIPGNITRADANWPKVLG